MSDKLCEKCNRYFSISGFYDHEPHCRNEAAKLLEQPVERTSYAWVIESTNSSPARPKYWRGNSTEHEAEYWNFDHKEAMRFESETLAKGYAEGRNLKDYRICQHGWDSERESGAPTITGRDVMLLHKRWMDTGCPSSIALMGVNHE